MEEQKLDKAILKLLEDAGYTYWCEECKDWYDDKSHFEYLHTKQDQPPYRYQIRGKQLKS